MHRRRYLTGIGGLPPTAAAVAGLFGGAGASADVDDGGSPAAALLEEWRYVDVVEYGADPTGDEDVTPVLEEIVEEEGGDELLVLFPPGTYLLESGFEHEDVADFGLLGVNATIELAEEFDGAGIYGDKAFALGPSASFAARNVYVGGFEFDLGAVDDAEATALVSYASGSVVFEHLSMTDPPAAGQRMLELVALDDCRGHICDCVVDGAPGAGIYVRAEDLSVVAVADCLVHGCADNGFYCSDGGGRAVLERVTALDNDISNVRIGGTVRDSLVGVTDSDLEDARGYWLRNGDCRVEGCIGYNDSEDSRTLLEVAPSAESVAVVDSRFESDADQRLAVVNDRPEADEHVATFRDCTFGGELNDDSADEAIAVARHDTAFVRCACSLTGDVTPIRFGDGAENCRVIGGRYRAERPIAFASGRGGLVRDADLVAHDADADLEVEISDVVVENVSGEVEEGVRTVIDGIGDNGADDPSEDGDWNGDGREGVLVAWTDEGENDDEDDGDENDDEDENDEDDETRRLSLYRGGEWYSWSVD